MNLLGPDRDFLGAELVLGSATVGHVDGVVRDVVSHRVWRLITRYGTTTRRDIAVPVEWIIDNSPRRFVLGVGFRSLDALPEHDGAPRTYPTSLKAAALGSAAS